MLTCGVVQKFPVVGDYFVREIPPSDNVSAVLRVDWRCGADVRMYSRSEIFVYGGEIWYDR